MTNDELIAALESAPEGTHELGVAVLEALGASKVDDKGWWVMNGDYRVYVCAGDEARVVTDLNFRLPDVPEGIWFITGPEDGLWNAVFMAGVEPFVWVHEIESRARTERLARCVAELKALLAVKEKV